MKNKIAEIDQQSIICFVYCKNKAFNVEVNRAKHFVSFCSSRPEGQILSFNGRLVMNSNFEKTERSTLQIDLEIEFFMYS